jgi:glucose/arabinose dehydrogenase
MNTTKFSPNKFSTLLLALFLSCVTIYQIDAHEYCIDGTAKQPTPMSYCTDYDMATCCSTTRELEIESVVEDLDVDAFALCKNYMRKMLCAECDPWSAHLFDYEIGDGRRTPFLCPTYCEQFYLDCASVPFDWPDGKNFFGGNTSTIVGTFPNVSLFCAAHTPNEEFGSCYDGTVFVPESPPPPALDTPVLCVEQLDIAGSDSTCCRITSIVSAFDGTDRLFVTKQGGSIQIIDTNLGVITDTFLTIPGVETAFNEGGLIGLVFHPKYSSNGKFYVHYTCRTSVCSVDCDVSNPYSCSGRTCSGGKCSGHAQTSVIAEYQVDPLDPNAADPFSERRLLSVAQPYDNHNAGQLLFGPEDGYLYVFFGDGGSANDPFNNAQHPDSWLGKVLRIDVDGMPDPGKNYRVPFDNPFVGQRMLSEVWAEGLRNPWRCAFDPDFPIYLFCGDVGQDNVEEFDLIVKGGNYGWRKWEGSRLNIPGDPPIPSHTLPFIEFSHADLGGNPSSIGGYVYRAQTVDERFVGKYIFGDHNPAYWAATQKPSGDWDVERITLTCASDSSPCGISGKLLTFGEDHDRNLYISLHTRLLKVVEPSRCGIIPLDGLVPLLQDTYVRSGVHADTNYGSDPELVVKYAPDSDFARESYLMFNLSGLFEPQCTLHLREVVLEPYSPPFRIFVRLLDDQTWDEHVITWNDRPVSSTTEFIGPIEIIPGTVSVDVTDLVEANEALGNILLSLHLQTEPSDDTFDKMSFGSKESTMGARLACTGSSMPPSSTLGT